MLAVLLVQVGTGLVSDDEISFTGPLSSFVTASQSLSATWFHKEVGQWTIVALVLLHIAAVAYYLVRKKKNLIKPMLDGDEPMATPVPPSRDDSHSRTLAAAVFAVCAVAVTWISAVGLTAREESSQQFIRRRVQGALRREGKLNVAMGEACSTSTSAFPVSAPETPELVCRDGHNLIAPVHGTPRPFAATRRTNSLNTRLGVLKQPVPRGRGGSI